MAMIGGMAGKEVKFILFRFHKSIYGMRYVSFVKRKARSICMMAVQETPMSLNILKIEY
jgi:hypothetical protein